MDSLDSPDDPGLRSQIGKFVITINVVFNFGSLAFMLAKALQTLYEIYKTYKARKSKQKIDLKIQTPDRLIPPQEIIANDASKNKIDVIEMAKFEHDQSTLKPLDLTDESFLTNQGPLIFEMTPKFETISNEIQEKKSQNSVQNILLENHSSDLIDQEDDPDDDKMKALRGILEKNELIRKELQFKTKLNEASLRVRNHLQILSQVKQRPHDSE